MVKVHGRVTASPLQYGGGGGDYFWAAAEAAPDKTFIAYQGRELTFAQVNHLTAKTSAWLQSHCQSQPGDKVGILMPNCLPYVWTVLALMRLRVIIVPLNTRLTADELQWQLEKAQCKLVICAPETLAKAKSCTTKFLLFPPESQLHPPAAIDRFARPALAEDFAIIHTSGTSGRPKATVLSYGNIYHSALASAQRLGALPDDRWLCVLPLCHVGGLSIILRSLIYGTAVELLPAFDVDAVNRLLSEQPISLVSLVPTMLQRLLAAKQRGWNPRLRLILLGGEAARLSLIERCLAEQIPVAASYGLSEASSQVATALSQQLREKSGTVGKPLPGTQARIVDEQGRTLAANTAGEVLVKGATVMRGYYDDVAATNRALRAGWLRTGDIGYLDADGDLFIMQRRSDLIISGGENIYPAEVEAALRQHPALDDALVFGLPDEQWGQRVAALVQLKPGEIVAVNELIDFAGQRLARYKIPREYAFAKLPRSAAGKVNRSAARKTFHAAIARR
ncbi:MAG: o-succinylbenzoate--CoA ligase [Chloroflexi bacterium]|nr:o-succinylbenzoate--CoA ligase [Chloroflexota bacterium]MXX51560.1 o-succinylbenzoate--CoA ligase [Chloroflexota bacterium]MXX82099.1 o-succinylbenzoate--CoA ligase [Chloroflexota bacterium]MYA93408.1 o-succinylbenzoate--CoA ligase [Chloroflexota bacterium]MYC55969.1 o-succinylbenzoate--CoA ligase [Chloroflexota bacterium]